MPRVPIAPPMSGGPSPVTRQGEADGPTNVAVQRPTVNIREAENVGEELAGEQRRLQPEVTFSKHGTFGPKTVTHPSLE